MNTPAESVSMSDNIKWGKRLRYEQGLVESLALPNVYGFSKKDGEIAINKQGAKVVNRIFREYLDGLGYERIVAGLNADNIPTRRGNDIWYNKTVQNIVLNEKYVGDVIFQGVTKIIPKTLNRAYRSNKSVNNKPLHC